MFLLSQQILKGGFAGAPSAYNTPWRAKLLRGIKIFSFRAQPPSPQKKRAFSLAFFLFI